jgi:hypothetical protein
MNRRQKAILIESVAIIVLTAVAVWGMINESVEEYARLSVLQE